MVEYRIIGRLEKVLYTFLKDVSEKVMQSVSNKIKGKNLLCKKMKNILNFFDIFVDK
jgi:hypothetical protein